MKHTETYKQNKKERLVKIHRLVKKHIISRDNEIILDLEKLKTDARERDDEATAQKLDGVIFRLLSLTR